MFQRAWCGRIVLAWAAWIGVGSTPIPAADGASSAGYEVRPAKVAAGTRTGFTPLDPVRTGLAFTNHLAPMSAARNQNLMNGSGVAAGDYDGDGRCDLFFCGISGTNALFRNLGDWRFEETTGKAGLSGVRWASSGATFADLDGDGDLDLLVSTLGSGVQCFRNEGAGRFRLVTGETGLASSAGSTSLVLGDVEGDGDLDLYVVNYGAESVLRSGGRAEIRRVSGQWEFVGPQAHRLRFVDGQVEEVGEVGYLYLNDGAGRFQAVPWNSDRFIGIDGRPKAPPFDYGLGAQMRDVNGDGAPDFYLCNDFQMPDRLWLNDGRGRFREAPFPVQRKFPFSSMGVDFGDLDRDGHLDFLVVEMAGRRHSRMMRQVSGLRPVPNLPGRFDYRSQVVRNCLFRSNGDGTWSEIAEFAGLERTDWSWQPVFLDVDLDGYEDVLVANGMMFDTQDRDTLARIQSFGRQTPEATRTNLALYPPYHSPNLAFRNLGRFAFRDVSTEWNFDSTRISQGVALADLDGDGDADLTINCLNDGALLYRNDSPAPRLSVRLRGRPPNTRGIGASIVVEGGPVLQRQEILAGGRYLSCDDTFRTFAAGGATGLVVRVTWRSGRTTTVSNVPPDTLLVVSENDGEPAAPPPASPKPAPWFADVSSRLGRSHHEPLFDDFARQPLLPKQLSSLGPGVAWIDLDGDGRDEWVMGTGRGGRLAGARFLADGTIVPLESEWAAPDDVAGLTGWVTRDGRPALLAALTGYEDPAAHPASLVEITLDRDGRRLRVDAVAGFPAFEASLGPVAASDFDGDGDLDLFVGSRVIPAAYPQAAASRLFRRDGAAFVPDSVAEAILQRAGMVSGAIWSDLENDGYPELILACEWGPIRILRNDRGQLSSWDPPVSGIAPDSRPARLSDATGWWTAVTTADLNGDGRLDILAANWGLNTGYRAQPDQPARLYFGKLAGSGFTDLIEAYQAEDPAKEVPRRSLNALSQAFPFLAARFPNHRTFAMAGMDEILTGLPVRPERLSATTLASTAFLNTPTGWVAAPLPGEAQYAPAFGLATADVDADGHDDVFVAQNFFAHRIEWPRTDAGRGLWMRGDGAGGFSPLPGSTSGVVIFGEQRGAAIGDADRDGRPDLAVAQNGAPATLWRHAGTGPALWVEVVGPAGNPAGYGTTLRTTGDSAVMREIRASAGYWSKDSAGVSFAGPVRPGELWMRRPGGKDQRIRIPATGRRLRIEMDGTVVSNE